MEPASQVFLRTVTEDQEGKAKALHKALQAPSLTRSANIQPVQASHVALVEPKVKGQRNILALLWKELQGFVAKGIFSDRESRATINHAVSAHSLFAISYSHVPDVLKVGVLVNKEGLSVMGECSLP